jgi:hypothetical protein
MIASNWPRRSWLEAEPKRLASEKEAMRAIVSNLKWIDDDPAGGWKGPVPEWPFDRPAPPHLEDFLADRRLSVRVEYLQSFPMVEPKVWPLDPEPEPRCRTDARWHVLGDGSLCLLRSASDWTGRETAADLVVKASGWFLEFLLMEAGLIEEMTVDGIANDPRLDDLFVEGSKVKPDNQNG